MFHGIMKDIYSNDSHLLAQISALVSPLPFIVVVIIIIIIIIILFI